MLPYSSGKPVRRLIRLVNNAHSRTRGRYWMRSACGGSCRAVHGRVASTASDDAPPVPSDALARRQAASAPLEVASPPTWDGSSAARRPARQLRRRVARHWMTWSARPRMRACPPQTPRPRQRAPLERRLPWLPSICVGGLLCGVVRGFRPAAGPRIRTVRGLRESESVALTASGVPAAGGVLVDPSHPRIWCARGVRRTGSAAGAGGSVVDSGVPRGPRVWARVRSCGGGGARSLCLWHRTARSTGRSGSPAPGQADPGSEPAAPNLHQLLT